MGEAEAVGELVGAALAVAGTAPPLAAFELDLLQAAIGRKQETRVSLRSIILELVAKDMSNPYRY